MAVFVVGLVGIIVFYIIVTAVGLWASTKPKNNSEDEVLLAGRSIGFTVGLLTLIATWVGGSYINATTEVIFTRGLEWCQLPFGFSLSLVVGTLLFAKPMREANYVTMLDPFQQKYGQSIGSLLFIPTLCGDIFYLGSILSALGSSLRITLEIDAALAITVSTIFAASYTIFGGLYSVTYTDVIQICFIYIGLILCTPFAYNDAPFKSDMTNSSTEWIGKVEPKDYGVWMDGILLLIFGAIPSQAYFQRILSLKSTKIAQTMGIVAAFGCLLIAIPAALVGIIARNVDWDTVPNFNRTIAKEDASIIMPLVFKLFTPSWVSFFGLGAISASVMSSADASILSSSSIFSRNIYKLTIRPEASEKEMLWVLRISVIVISVISAIIAVTVRSIYYLNYLSVDLLYIISFPQLLLVIYWPNGVTRYGYLTSYAVGLILRLLGGEKELGIPMLIHYPWYDNESETQLFPFKTFCLLVTLFIHIFISCFLRWIFTSGIISADEWDFLYDFPECHLMKHDQIKEPRHKEGAKCRSNKAVHDAVVGKRLSQSSNGYLTNNDDENSIATKRDRNSITYQTSTTSEEPSISII